MQKRSLCRVCVALCPVKVEVDAAGLPVSATGDKDNSHSEGFFCAKGKYYPAMHRSDTRFLHSQKRMPDGELAAISSQAAIEEVAERIQAIIDQYGPRSVAIYSGTLFYQASSTAAMASAWCSALGLKMLFSSGNQGCTQPFSLQIRPHRKREHVPGAISEVLGDRVAQAYGFPVVMAGQPKGLCLACQRGREHVWQHLAREKFGAIQHGLKPGNVVG